MISERALGKAVAEAAVTAEQAERLRAIERELAQAAAEPVEDENLRFLTGFADIFVTIGLVLFLGALAFLMDAGSGSTPMYAGLAACSWLLAEFFTFRRRMALPSIFLLVVFIGAIFILSAQIFAAVLPGQHVAPGHAWFPTAQDYLPLGLAALVTAGMAALHYAHFRVPITVAAGAGALCILVVALIVGLVPGIDEVGLDLVLLACGIAVFALAMRFDVSDRERMTRRTDIAFWLHLLAAPLIVHSLMMSFLARVAGGAHPMPSTAAALGVLWIFLLLGLVAVVVDRRAILVSGLLYAGGAFGIIVNTLGIAKVDYQLSGVALALGAFVLLLSAGWSPLRRALLKRLPARIAGRLPHPLVTSQA